MNTLIFADKNAAEVLPYSVEFIDRLLVGETISTPLVTILVSSGTDPSPSAMLSGSPTVSGGNTINFILTGGVPGVVYTIVVTALISSSNVYLKVGHLAIVASDPFASS